MVGCRGRLLSGTLADATTERARYLAVNRERDAGRISDETQLGERRPRRVWRLLGSV